MQQRPWWFREVLHLLSRGAPTPATTAAAYVAYGRKAIQSIFASFTKSREEDGLPF